MDLSQYIDHTVLSPTATPADIESLCAEAKKYNFYAVCVNGSYVNLASTLLKDSPVKVAAVIGFPLGAMSTKAKIAEARDCVENGADEIDMVINLGLLKAGQMQKLETEIAQIKEAIGEIVLKVIIETCYLTEEEKKNACKAALNAKANFVKTSTGFGSSGATIEDVKLMKAVVGDKLQVKASGGIRDTETAKEFIKAGANRLGTSSGIKLVTSNQPQS